MGKVGGNVRLISFLLKNQNAVMALSFVITTFASYYLFSTRTLAAILGGIVGVWFSPKLVTYNYSKSVYVLIAFIIALPFIVRFLDNTNKKLPDNRLIKSVVSFIEGGILGSIVVIIVANLFPV